MSGPFGSSQWMYNTGGSFYDYEIDGSLRFEAGDSAYLSRNMSASNRKTFTISCWVKRSELDGDIIMGRRVDGDNQWTLQFQSGGQLDFYNQTSGSVTVRMITNALFRDVSAWYHIVLKVDVTTGTSANAIYVNGVEQSLSTDTSSNSDTYVNSSGTHYIGQWQAGGSYDGYMADFYFIDGQALDPTSFGETKSGIWVPKEYSGTYGTNGFHLEFAGNANDTSGNGNNFTSFNISSSDYVPDSPTNNWSVLEGIQQRASYGMPTLSQGNLQFGSSGISSSWGYRASNMEFSSGKWYAECRVSGNTYSMIGVFNTGYYGENHFLDQNPQNNTGGWMLYMDGATSTNTKFNGSTASASFTDYNNDGIVGMELDADNGTVKFYVNGTLQTSIGTGGTVNISAGTGDAFRFWSLLPNGSGTTYRWNFGQDSTFTGTTTAGGNTDENGYGDFKYAPSSGYLAACSANLPAPAIDPLDDETPEDYFNTVLWTGTGSGQSITGMGFQPDWLWFKQRNGTSDHALIDSVRGVNQGLVSSSTAAEVTSGASNDLVSFDSDGFTTGTPQNFGSLGSSGFTIATWGWKGGNGTVTNNDGSVTTTVSVNPDAGFSVVGYSGSGTTSTFGHGLGTPVDCMIIKRRNGSTNWIVKHKGLPNYNTTGYIQFDTSIAYLNDPNAGLTGTNNTTFTISNSYGTQNTSGGTYVAYCFSEREGYSKIGSYRGNGSTDGTFVYTGFKPAWVLIRLYDNGGTNWLIYDVKRDLFNVTDEALLPNSSSATGGSANAMDIVSNGFKFRSSAGSLNANNYNYIYMAFAEQPFKYANAR